MFRIFWILFFSYFSLPILAETVWIQVDTQLLKLEVKQGEQVLATFDDIAIGQWGAGFKRRRGDDITPLGTYKIGWINEKSHYYRFYGFNYPSIDNARRALAQKLINEEVFQDIKYAHKHDQVPSQRTPMGGQLGIHGLGRADKRIHSMVNWTHGCIALTNEQIDRLDQWLKIGTLVKVK